jgi:lysozyme
VTASDIAQEQLKTDEGLRLKPYHCTAGALTIGYGRNLDAVGITEAEADIMLRADIEIAERGAKALVGNVWEQLSPARQAVLINMTFNLGRTRLAAFKNFLAALRTADYDTAADEMLDSRWARQVGDRATRLSDAMRHG